jgi:hypothetical protein
MRRGHAPGRSPSEEWLRERSMARSTIDTARARRSSLAREAVSIQKSIGGCEIDDPQLAELALRLADLQPRLWDAHVQAVRLSRKWGVGVDLPGDPDIGTWSYRKLVTTQRAGSRDRDNAAKPGVSGG